MSLTCIRELYMCLNFTPNPSCKAVYLSKTIFMSFWYICMRIIISIKFFTIGNFVEITIKPFKRSYPYGAWFHQRFLLMLKESLKAPLFTDGFRLSDLLCQSYPHMYGLEISECLRKKCDRGQPSVRLAMCERSPLGLPHTQNRMSGRP